MKQVTRDLIAARELIVTRGLCRWNWECSDGSVSSLCAIELAVRPRRSSTRFNAAFDYADNAFTDPIWYRVANKAEVLAGFDAAISLSMDGGR